MMDIIQDGQFKEVEGNPDHCNDLTEPCFLGHEGDCTGCKYYRNIEAQYNIPNYFNWTTKKEVEWLMNVGKQFVGKNPFRYRGARGADRRDCLIRYARSDCDYWDRDGNFCRKRDNWGDIDKDIAIDACKQLLMEEYGE
jgi:hypothetical protein